MIVYRIADGRANTVGAETAPVLGIAAPEPVPGMRPFMIDITVMWHNAAGATGVMRRVAAAKKVAGVITIVGAVATIVSVADAAVAGVILSFALVGAVLHVFVTGVAGQTLIYDADASISIGDNG